jgi:hypothetical protein
VRLGCDNEKGEWGVWLGIQKRHLDGDKVLCWPIGEG